MPNLTTNLQLQKPLVNENYDINVHNSNYDIIDNAIKEANDKIDLIELTADKVSIADTGNKFTATNVEGALLEAINKADSAFQSANSGKTTLATAIGSPVINTDTFTSMGTKINTLKNTLATNNTNKGVAASGTETLESLINKVSNINLGKKWASGIAYLDTTTPYTSKSFSTVCETGYYNTTVAYFITIPKPSFEIGTIVAYSDFSSTYNLAMSMLVNKRIVAINSQKEFENSYYDNHNTTTIMGDHLNPRQNVFYDTYLHFPVGNPGLNTRALNYIIFEK